MQPRTSYTYKSSGSSFGILVLAYGNINLVGLDAYATHEATQ